MKQNAFSPVPVEKQVAIIYLGTKGLLAKVPVERVREFEGQFFDLLEMQHKDVLDQLKKGVINDDITNRLESVANELVSSFSAQTVNA